MLDELHSKLKKQKVKFKVYDDYYKGKHKILSSETWDTRNNITEVHNFCKLFIDNNTGFLLGNNIQLKYSNVSEGTTIVDYYNRYLSSRVQQLNQKLLRDMQIYGHAYEVNYINKDGNFDLTIKTPLELAVIRDGNKVTHGLLQQSDDVFDYFEVLEGKITRCKLGENGKLIKTDVVLENTVPNPIIVVYNSWEKQSEMENIMTLNDSYNQVSSDATSEINEFRNAYMHFKGARINEEILREMNNSGVISTPGDSDVKFITKDVNGNFIESKIQQLESQIYNMGNQVNFNDTQLGSNTSSLALRNKLTNMINHLRLKEGFLREAIYLRLKNLASYVQLMTLGRVPDELIDPNKVDITFLMNIPTSDKETAEMVIALYEAGLISKETAVSQLSFVSVTQDELEKIEYEEAIKLDDLMRYDE